MHEHTSADSGHGAHADHTGHENLFRRKFRVSLILSIPVILYSMGLQMMIGLVMPAFPGSEWIAPVFAVIVFFYGGLPFLQMAVPEIKNRQPGMMTLISLAISVAFIYSVATLFLPGQVDFFWELVTLIDIMLPGHWIEMRSNPLDVVKIIQLGRSSYRKMMQNLGWAAGYNVVALPLAAGVLAPVGILLSPAVGAILMSLSTVIVAINAQLLRRATL